METCWKTDLPIPIYEDIPEYGELYQKAWELAYDHIKEVEGMPASPYMDEAFCDTQIWIWDTCFMSLFCKFASGVFPGIESLNNFYEVLYGNKSLPAIIPTEREPAWTGATSGIPKNIEIHIADNPPLFAWAEYENALFHGNLAYVKELLYRRQVLQKHYEWIESLTEETVLPNVHCKTCLIRETYGYRWEGGRSGMDNTPRGRTAERTNKNRPNNPDMLWLDAICQQALSAKMIALLFGLVKDLENQTAWDKRYQEKKAMVNALYWDREDRFYYDIDRRTHDFYKVMTIASYWALTAGIADEERAEAMASQITNAQTFGGDVPLRSLVGNDANYEPDGRYWRGALWLPTAYAALKGLSLYGYHEKARNAARKILDHMLKTYRSYEPHTIWECYAPEDCKPSTAPNGKENVRPDFCGWSALGPITIYIEYVLGFHTVNAFERLIEWEKPDDIHKEIGIRNLRFGDIVTDIVANGKTCFVRANHPYMLKINGKPFPISVGEQTLNLI